MNLGYFADSRGRIVTEVTIIRWAEDEFWLMTAAVAQWHDFEFLQKALPQGGTLSLTDITQDWSTLLVTGPASRDLLAGLSAGADLQAGWLGLQDATVAGKQAKLMRISFAGELGWEVHTRFDDSAAVYDALRASGATPFGMYALNALRLEKGYRSWKGDLSSDYSLLEGGLDRFIRFDKPQDFPGKAALLREAQQGPARRIVTLIIDAGDQDPPYMATIWSGDAVVGEVTSGGWGYRVNACIGLGMVRADLAAPGTVLEVEIYGQRCSATVQPDQPLWDPENTRIRA